MSVRRASLINTSVNSGKRAWFDCRDCAKGCSPARHEAFLILAMVCLLAVSGMGCAGRGCCEVAIGYTGRPAIYLVLPCACACALGVGLLYAR